MIYKGVSRRAVVLLGAGATRGAFRHVNYRHKRLRPPLNRDFFKVADTFARAHGPESIDSKRLNRIRNFFQTSVPTKLSKLYMEDAFSILFVAKDLHEVYRAKPGRLPDAGTSAEVDDFLLLVQRILHVFNGQQSSYGRLVSTLESNDTVISLNYDTVLDSALHEAGWDPAVGYSLKGGTKKVKWKPQPGIEDSRVRRLKLLKLHGSLNWFARGSTKRLHEVFDKKPSLVCAPSHNSRSGYVRQIIPPIYGKSFRHSHWAHLWMKAYEECLKADLFVVVGCSLINTDFHLRAFLSRVCAVRKKSGRRFHRVLLADRARIRRKWLGVLKGTFVDSELKPSFDSFLREILRA